jgi:hypothetical protein
VVDVLRLLYGGGGGGVGIETGADSFSDMGALPVLTVRVFLWEDGSATSVGTRFATSSGGRSIFTCCSAICVLCVLAVPVLRIVRRFDDFDDFDDFDGFDGFANFARFALFRTSEFKYCTESLNSFVPVRARAASGCASIDDVASPLQEDDLLL